MWRGGAGSMEGGAWRAGGAWRGGGVDGVGAWLTGQGRGLRGRGGPDQASPREAGCSLTQLVHPRRRRRDCGAGEVEGGSQGLDSNASGRASRRVPAPVTWTPEPQPRVDPRVLCSWSVAGDLWLGSRRSRSEVGGTREQRAHLSHADRSHRPEFRSVGFPDAPRLTSV